ncbi:MAG: hypothetical protein AAFY28_16745, partial [Actinomycetota bacterium]
CRCSAVCARGALASFRAGRGGWNLKAGSVCRSVEQCQLGGIGPLEDRMPVVLREPDGAALGCELLSERAELCGKPVDAGL